MKEENKQISVPGILLEIGFEISIPLVLFVVLGVFIDKKFNTLPLFLLLGVFISLVTTSLAIAKVIKKYLKDIK